MSKGKTSVNIPSFSKPAVPTFHLPGFGRTTYGNNAYGLELDPEQEAYQGQVKALRNSILSGLGITSAEREASLNQWQDTFQREAARTTMPQLEQTLFSRGLGGSKFYEGAVTDLLSKIATQGVLNREALAAGDEELKLSQLAQITGMDQTNLANMSGLIGQATGQYNTDYSNALSLYNAQLPYLATVTKKGNPLMGAITGGLTGFMTGGPWGAAIGAGAGALGNAGSTTTPYALANTDGGSSMNWLSYLQNIQPTTARTPSYLDYENAGFHGAGYANYPGLYRSIYGA